MEYEEDTNYTDGGGNGVATSDGSSAGRYHRCGMP